MVHPSYAAELDRYLDENPDEFTVMGLAYALRISPSTAAWLICEAKIDGKIDQVYGNSVTQSYYRRRA